MTRQTLRIGVHAEGEGMDGWVRILRQERIPWDAVDGPERRIILFSGVLPRWCADFVADGGVAVISGAPAADGLLGPSLAATIHRFRPPEDDRDCTMPCLARLFAGEGSGEVRLHENRKARGGRLADVFPAILTRRLGRGWLIYTGLPLAAHLVASGDCLRSFAEVSAITERVASVDKADIADTLLWMLRAGFGRLGLPYARLARYPDAAESVFLFRIDVDGLFGENCRDMALVARRHGIQGSFYFNASLCRAYPGALSREWLETHEIGHHADAHDLFDTVDDNRANLLGGMAWVEQHLGVRTTAYVAPRGLWNGALDQAMAGLGHLYSSDFGVDIDSLPFFTPAGVVQIPVHPFSAERYAVHEEDAGRGPPTARAVLAHYLAALDRQHALRRPAHLYGHPEILGRMADTVLPKLFEDVARRNLPSMTLGAFADWWRRRDGVELALFTDGKEGHLHVEPSEAGHAIDVETSPGMTVTAGAEIRYQSRTSGWAVLRP